MRHHLPTRNGFRPGRGPSGLVLPRGLEPRVARVAIAYPYGSGLTGPFAESLLRLEEYELSKPARGQQPLLWHRLPQAGLYIAENRNRIAANFLKARSPEGHPADWLLSFDSDIEFPATIIESLLEHAGDDKKILAASVPLGDAWPTSAFDRTERPGIWWPLSFPPWCARCRKQTLVRETAGWRCAPCGLLLDRVVTEEPVQCDGIATAVVMIHREVFEAIADRHGQCWYHHIYVPRDGREPVEGANNRDVEFISQGEDLAFCLRAAREGYKSWCVVVPGLRHHKTLPLSHDFEKPPAEQDEQFGREPMMAGG